MQTIGDNQRAHIGQFMMNHELENCVDFPTGIGDMEPLHCVYWWIHDMICMLVMLRFMAWNMVCERFYWVVLFLVDW